MSPFFISCNLQAEHMETSENFNTPMPKTELFFSSLQICQQSSSIFEQKHVFLPSKSCSLSSADTGTQHSAVLLHWHYGVLSCFFQRTTQVIIWWCQSRILRWMLQHYLSKVSDGLHSAYNHVWPSTVMVKQHFRHFSCKKILKKVSIQTSSVSVKLLEFTVVPLGHTFTRMKPISSQTNVSTPLQLTAHAWISPSWLGCHEAPTYQQPLWFRFKIADPGFIPHDNLW
jgi:hypothetical protein